MWSVFSKGRIIFFSPNLNLVNRGIERTLDSSLRFYRNIKNGDPLPSFDPDAIEYMLALDIPNDGTVLYEATDQEITGSEIWSAINSFVVGAKSQGIYGIGWQDAHLATSLIEGYYPVIGGDATRHSINIADTTNNLVFLGSWVHNQFGFTGNGTNTYARTGIIPSGNPRIGGDNMVLGIYSRTDQAPNNCNPCRTYMGSRGSGFGQATTWYARSNQFNVILNNNGGTVNPTSMSTIKGFNTVRRIGNTYTNYVEGVSVSTNTENSLQPSTTEIYLGALNQTGSAFEYVNINWIGGLIANTMTDTQMLEFRNLVNTLNGVLNRLPV
jgi:hypothetical protein